LFVNQALTTAPGANYSGAAIVPSNATFATSSPLSAQSLATLPTSHLSSGFGGASATARPIDPDSFSFFGFNITGLSASNAISLSVPYVVVLGSVPSSTVYLECVVNLEATTSVTAVGILPDSDGATDDRLCDYWPSFESMWNKIAGSLPHPGRLTEAAAATDDTYLSLMWDSISRGVQYAGRSVLRRVARSMGSAAASSVVGGYSVNQNFPSQLAGFLQ